MDMYDQIILLLTILITFLTVLVAVFLMVLTVVLVTLKKTLIQLQAAIDNVEDTALRSLAPFLSLQTMISDFGGFFKAVQSVTKSLSGKKSGR